VAIKTVKKAIMNMKKSAVDRFDDINKAMVLMSIYAGLETQ